MQQSEVRTQQTDHITEESGSRLHPTASHTSNEMSGVENLEFRSDISEIQSQLDGRVTPIMRNSNLI